MSHVVDIKCEITDLDALEAACRRLGLELARGQKTHRWYGRYVGDSSLPEGVAESDLGKCAHAVRLPGSDRAYEVGLVPNASGKGWTLHYDNWSGGYGMSEKVGHTCGKLLQAYAAEKLRLTVAKTHRVTEQRLPNGSIRMTLMRG